MGSSSSKPNAVEESQSQSSTSSLPSSCGRNRTKGNRVFQSSCLGQPYGSEHSDDDEQSQENGCNGPGASHTDRVKAKCYRKVKTEQPDSTACLSSSNQYDEWDHSNLSNSVSRAGCSRSGALSTQSLSRSSRFLSRFRLFPGNSSFKLSRATSLGSSRAYPVSATSEDQLHLDTGPTLGSVNRNELSRGRNLLPACLIARSPPPRIDNFASDCLESNPTTSLNVARDVENPRGESNVLGMGTRVSDRHMERNVRFSRTLSVGRLRDRVRRSTFPDFTFSSLEQEREAIDTSHEGGMQALGAGIGASHSSDNALISSDSSVHASTGMRSSFNNRQDSEVETFRARDSMYHDLLERRSHFLERRRRIGSQVHALQQLGSRFENLCAHERSCIISREYRTGHCSCPIGTRVSNSSDDASSGASISRIVMLAETLFEVLDEIHQQSVLILPSVSSTGSVPAPSEVVEVLPEKLYSASQRHLYEEAAQCYICLVEYEEGDSVRILPCHHEFHKSCADKWLKEIHRVCPLCRGDICRSDPVSSSNWYSL